jgi:hypothetical protein
LAERDEFELPVPISEQSDRLHDIGVSRRPDEVSGSPEAQSPGRPTNIRADGSAGHVENGICSLGLVGKRLDGFVRGQNQQINFSVPV